MNELNTRQWFINFLKNNLNYLDSNFILEKRINNSIIDLLIVVYFYVYLYYYHDYHELIIII